MAVELRSVGVSPGVVSTSCVIVKPAGLSVGDLMLAHISCRKYTGTIDAVVPPANWTEIRQDLNNDSAIRSALFWKIAVQADVGATDFTFTTDDLENLGAITAWTGHDATTPINANNGQGNDASTTVTSPAITPSVASCMICMFCCVTEAITVSNYAIATSNPASWSEAYDMNTTAGWDVSTAMGYAERAETTSTGNGTATLSASERNIGQIVAIAPAAVATFIPTVMII